jgi:rSAM/selenodomain-associated transferase 2
MDFAKLWQTTGPYFRLAPVIRLATYWLPLFSLIPDRNAVIYRLSIIIPVFNEAGLIESALAALQPLRERGAEVIVVDGGSTDGTAELAASLACRVIRSPRGRAVQMNAGARAATGGALLFLHADTRLPAEAERILAEAFAVGAVWGRFDVRLSGGHPLLRMVETLMNWRSRLTGIATGDQAMFVRREVFERIGGFPEIPLMEDIALSKILKRIARPACPGERVAVSSRRWEERGILRTILLMWWLRLRYFLGADPADLVRSYYRTSTPIDKDS